MNNYPDGVTESMIPGFRPQDEAYESFAEECQDEDDQIEFIGNELGDLVYEGDDGWYVEEEDDGSYTWFATEEAAVSYFIAARGAWLVEQMAQQRMEEWIDAQY